MFYSFNDCSWYRIRLGYDFALILKEMNGLDLTTEIFIAF